MAATRICRLCCNIVTSTRCSALFSKESVQRCLPDRLGKLLELPISECDGLSSYICRACTNKFQSLESKLKAFRSMAKCGFEQGRNKASICSPMVSGRKRTKDTSGLEASPHTVHARPLAKRLTVGAPGRRLAFSTREERRLIATNHICRIQESSLFHSAHRLSSSATAVRIDQSRAVFFLLTVC